MKERGNKLNRTQEDKQEGPRAGNKRKGMLHESPRKGRLSAQCTYTTMPSRRSRTILKIKREGLKNGKHKTGQGIIDDNHKYKQGNFHSNTYKYSVATINIMKSLHDIEYITSLPHYV